MATSPSVVSSATGGGSIGTDISTRVPFPRAEVMESSPPPSRAVWASRPSPAWPFLRCSARSAAEKPRPSSRIDTSSRSLSVRTVTHTVWHWACLTTFRSASWITR